MKALKYIGMILTFVFVSLSANAQSEKAQEVKNAEPNIFSKIPQIEFKFAPVSMYIDVPMVSAEVIVDNFGLEGQFRKIGHDYNNTSLTLIGKSYLTSDNIGRLYLGLYGQYTYSEEPVPDCFLCLNHYLYHQPEHYGKSSVLTLGAVGGYKFEIESFIIDIQAGMGAVLGSYRKYNVYDGFSLNPKLSFTIGYRFFDRK